jgi:hypothetical protein
MKFRSILVTAVVACAVGWVGRAVHSDEAPPSPEAMKEMEAAFKKLAQPGEEHARLRPLVGEWNVRGKFTGFDGKVTESDSTASISMVLGGRFLRQEAVGSFEGQAFVGRGLIGFDNATRKWVSSWIDSMSTGIMTGEGVETVKGKRWEFKSTFNGPTGPMTMRDVLQVVNANELEYQGFMGDSKTPMMTLRYRRR